MCYSFPVVGNVGLIVLITGHQNRVSTQQKLSSVSMFCSEHHKSFLFFFCCLFLYRGNKWLSKEKPPFS